MTTATCSHCSGSIEPGTPIVSWFAQDERGFTIKRGAVHLACLTNLTNGSQA